MAREEIPFVMEVTGRTEADRKGGHIAARPGGGGYLLRETAQTPDEDLDALQDIGRHKLRQHEQPVGRPAGFNDSVLRERDGVLGLPLIVNRKTVDPSDKSSPEVFQLETAMGAAVGVFEGARPLLVPRAPLARSRRPRTCSRCARTPTCWARARGSSWTPAATAARR